MPTLSYSFRDTHMNPPKAAHMISFSGLQSVHHLLRLLTRLSSRRKAHTVVVSKSTTNAGSKQKHTQCQDLRNHLPRLRRISSLSSSQATNTQLSSQSISSLRAARVPQICRNSKHQIIRDRVSNHSLGLLLQRLAVGLVQALLGEQLHRLLAAGHDCRDGGDQAEREQVVGGAREVVGRREGVGDGIGEVTAQAVQDVEAVAQREEGDGEVDGGGVDGLPFRDLVSER
jgi:hypothetical protein